MLQCVLPLTAGLATLLEKDREGTKQFAYSFGSAMIVQVAGKEIVGKLRPNENNESSYPSGHTTAAFSGAGFINQRYGPWFGVPALGAAAFVGYSRIQSDNHFADHVLAGMSIGLMTNWAVVTPYEGRVKIVPALFGQDAPGMMLTITEKVPQGASGQEVKKVDSSFDPRFRYIFDFGPVWNSRNTVRSPDGSASIDLTQFKSFEQETMASRLFLVWHLAPKHVVAFEWAPYESRNRETITDSLEFQGDSFTGDVRYAYRLYEYRLKYAYELIKSKSWQLRIGGSLGYIYNSLELKDDSGNYARKRTETILPQIYAQTIWRFAQSWELFAEGSWGQSSGECSQDLSLGITWHINPQWMLSGGYRYYDRRVDHDDWYNHLTQQQPFLSLGYCF